jgi:hypothetical protein
MTSQKLFQVLVVGGALVGAGCREEEPARADAGPAGRDGGPDETDAGGTLVDASLPTDATMTLDVPVTPGDDAGGLTECGFCPNPDCCVPDGAGGSMERPGFVCCWSTSC